MKLAMALLVSATALANAENNPEVFRTFHLTWQAQPGATNYGVDYTVNGLPGTGHQQFPVGNAISADLNFLIPGDAYSFLVFWTDAGGTQHFFGPRTDYTAPGAGELGINGAGRVRYVVKPNQRTRLLASADLKNWTVVADKVWPVDGIAEYFGGTNEIARFYRALDN